MPNGALPFDYCLLRFCKKLLLNIASIMFITLVFVQDPICYILMIFGCLNCSRSDLYREEVAVELHDRVVLFGVV